VNPASFSPDRTHAKNGLFMRDPTFLHVIHTTYELRKVFERNE
jgi:hypothetical protein